MTRAARIEIAKRLRKTRGIMAFVDALGIDPDGDWCWTDVSRRVADLIDPTCHLVETIKNEWPDGSTTYLHRLSCGHMCETVHRSSPVFCPYCGARLTNCGVRVVAGGDD